MRGVKDWDNQDTEKGLPHNPSLNNLQYLWDFDIETANEMMTSPEWTRAIFIREPKERFLSAFLDKAVANYGLYATFHCCPDAMNCKRDHYNNNTSLKNVLVQNCQEEAWDSRKNRLSSIWFEDRPCCTLFKQCNEQLTSFEGFLETIESCSNSHWRKFLVCVCVRLVLRWVTVCQVLFPNHRFLLFDDDLKNSFCSP